ncbi:MAG: bifunctional 3,4-dihydroxy-2-butanone 4-phosphate synthase/GTP cyclohydrolase II [Campylobacterales bacterium]
MSHQRVLEAIEEIKAGRMVIMMDDEDRENEGDLVYAATFSTPEMVNFMAREARGLICVAIDKATALRFGLTPMVNTNTSQHETAFTISIDSKNATTGISAFERDETIRLMADPTTTAEDFVSPGHIFPLVAREGGVLVRVGHTEGATDLCRLAGVAPVGVICEIMKDDGTMARRDDLLPFAQRHGLKIIYISDLVEYRLARESLITKVYEEPKHLFGSDVVQQIYRDHLNREHTVVLFGEAKEESAVKFHTTMRDSALLTDNAKFTSLMNSIDYLKTHGGILVFIDNRGELPGVKEFGIGAQILHALGVKRVQLLTSSGNHDFGGLKGFGLIIAGEKKI